MPKAGLQLSPDAEAIVARVKAALVEERRKVALLLEERHVIILADLSSQLCQDCFLRATASFPDCGPDLVSQEDLVSHESTSSLPGHQRSQEPSNIVESGCHLQCDPNSTIGYGSISIVDVSKNPARSSPDHDNSVDAEPPLMQNYDSLLSAAAVPQQLGKVNGLWPQVHGGRGSCQPLHSFGTKGHTKNLEKFTRDVVIRRLTAKLGPMSPGELLSADKVHASLEALTLLTYDVEQVRDLFRTLKTCIFPPEESIEVNPARITRKELVRRSRRSRKADDEFTLPFHDFVDVLVMDALEIEELCGLDVSEQTVTIKDILLSSDANCLIAELMHLRVDDIAAPRSKATLLDNIEPLISGVIILNAILIGLQTIPSIAKHPATIAADMVILFAFIVEFIVKIRYHGVYLHFCGPDLAWNWFDISIILLAIADLIVNLSVDMEESGFNTSTMTIVRTTRLTRLARLARIFRVSWLRELYMVCKGLIGGLRTLFWAVVLLFFIIYVVAVLLTTTLGQSKVDNPEFEDLRMQHFSTLPRAAFTTFRCLLIVECAADSGKPILVLTANRYGWIVPIAYMLIFIAVSVGLMNLITAIYIEMTLREAKNTDENDKQQRHRESVRVAKALKNLLLKVVALQSGYRRSMTSGEVSDLMSTKSSMPIKTKVDAQTEISKEVFLIAIQDQEVQQIMNDLDIPPERAQLFDVLDADGSGELKPSELLNGLLKVRGEARRSDTAALWLAVRAVQTHLHIVESHLSENHHQLLEVFRMTFSFAEGVSPHASEGPQMRSTVMGPRAI